VNRTTLLSRLAPLIERGLIERAPTPWQILQGNVEMLPYVVIPDADDRRRYAGATLGNPIVRTPFLVAYTLGGHFSVGSGLSSSEASLQKHLLAVHHNGQPVYDLQLAQTFPDGLTRLRARFLDVRSARSRALRLERTLVGAIVPSWDGYCDAMLGHIDRAARFDYDPAPAWCPDKFWSFASFMNHCASAFPPFLRNENPFALPRRLFRLFTAKWRTPPR
jgi:hypothetical protein